MNVKDVFRKETGEHIEIEKEFNDGVFVDVYNENYIAWLERKVNVTLGSVSACLEFIPSTQEGLFCTVCNEHKEYHSKQLLMEKCIDSYLPI